MKRGRAPPGFTEVDPRHPNGVRSSALMETGDQSTHSETVRGMRLLLVSHELTLSGAPLLIVQLGRLLRRAGMIVRLASSGLGGGDHRAVVRRASEAGIELVALPPP